MCRAYVVRVVSIVREWVWFGAVARFFDLGAVSFFWCQTAVMSWFGGTVAQVFYAVIPEVAADANVIR
jgi:hypothetical protein